MRLAAAFLALGLSTWASAPEPVSPAPRAEDLRLAAAIQTADLDLVKAALAAGANPNVRGTNGLTPLLELIAGAKTPLSEPQRATFRYLLDHGANAAATDDDGRTPLIHAARAGDLETVRLLVETAYVYVRTRDRFHTTALLYAAKAGYRDIVVYLASNGDIQSPTVRERKERGRR